MTENSATHEIDEIIKLHGGWKGDILTQIRKVITAADSDIFEEVKWKTASRPEGLPVWSHGKMFCVAEIWKDNVKLIFTKGAYLKDPNKLFNARLESTDFRAIEFHEGDTVNESKLTTLVHEAIKFNKQKA